MKGSIMPPVKGVYAPKDAIVYASTITMVEMWARVATCVNYAPILLNLLLLTLYYI